MRKCCQTVVGLLCLSVLFWSLSSVQGEPEKSVSTAGAKKSASLPPEIKQALSEFNSLIGGWRGVGMIKRNSRKGAWSEKAEWVWKFDPQQSGIAYEVEDGKFLKSALLSYDPEQKTYQLATVLPDDTKRRRLPHDGHAHGRPLPGIPRDVGLSQWWPGPSCRGPGTGCDSF